MFPAKAGDSRRGYAAMKSGTSHDLSHICFEGKEPARRQRSYARRACPAVLATPAPATEEQPDDSLFIAWVMERAGLDAAAYRLQPLHRRLPSCLRAMKVRSTQAARDLLERKPQLVASAVSSLLIGVTEFFREPAVFDSLRTRILPVLAGGNRRLQIWSAACSSGAELFSMAILLSETGLLERSYLLGTDCRDDAIERARLGLYDGTALKHVPSCDAGRLFRASRAALEAGRGPPQAGPLESRRPVGGGGEGAVGHHFVAECWHLPQVPSRGNDLAAVAVGPGTGRRAGCRQSRAAAQRRGADADRAVHLS